jgi:hypothetical protein
LNKIAASANVAAMSISAPTVAAQDHEPIDTRVPATNLSTGTCLTMRIARRRIKGWFGSAKARLSLRGQALRTSLHDTVSAVAVGEELGPDRDDIGEILGHLGHAIQPAKKMMMMSATKAPVTRVPTRDGSLSATATSLL